MDHNLRDLERAAVADPTDAGRRARFVLAGARCGLLVTWRGGPDFELQPAGTLVNEYFTDPYEQCRRVAALNTELNLGLSNEVIANAWQTIPAWPRKPLTALILVWYQDTIQETFESQWRGIQAVHQKHWRSDQINSDRNHLCLLPGINHPGTCLRWEVIDLAANSNRDQPDGIAPHDVRSPKSSPHAGILAAAALHPTWVTSMEGIKVPYVWAAGYLGGGLSWRVVPWLGFGFHNRKVELLPYDGGSGLVSYAVPSFFEE